jgi:hypothetical protein
MTSADTATERQPQSAAAPSPFPPIADYAFLSNCHTGAGAGGHEDSVTPHTRSPADDNAEHVLVRTQVPIEGVENRDPAGQLLDATYTGFELGGV